MPRLTWMVFINLAYYYGTCPLLREETVPVQCQCSASGQLAISLVTSFVPRLMIVIFGLETRLLVRMRTKLQKGVLGNGNFGPGKIGPGTKISAEKNGPLDHIF